MARPPLINPPVQPEEIFQDRRAKRSAEPPPPGMDRRSKQQFDAIPWWLKVNYTKAHDPAKPPLVDEPAKQINK